MTSIDDLFAKPGSGFEEVLKTLRLDVSYERAEGDYLFTTIEDQQVPILDVVGGFGVNLLGHYHPDLVSTLEESIRERVPFSAQGSIRAESVRLREAIRERFGTFEVVLTNSGAETVEAAIKHACLERGKTEFWCVRHSYHGKTLGAWSLTSRRSSLMPQLAMSVRVLDPHEPETWRQCEQRIGHAAGVFFEPIQGEGGIRVMPKDFCSWLTECCQPSGVPLVADEIQCGLGRVGSWLASSQLGISPDYICLGKALGGGLVKIGALLIDERRFRPEFRWQHTSTFAEDGLSSRVAHRVLSLIDRDAILKRCQETGSLLKRQLESLRTARPDVIADVRGRGLMLGLEFAEQADNNSNTIRLLSHHKLIGFLAASYLLNVHRIRIAPTISDPHTIRVQPSAYFTEENISQFAAGLLRFCDAIHRSDAGTLLAHVFGRGKTLALNRPRLPQRIGADRCSGENKVAFIAHPLEAVDLKKWDSSLDDLEEADLSGLSELGTRLLGPSLYDQYQVRSATGQAVHLTWIGLLPTSAQMIAAYRNSKANFLVQQIEEALQMAIDRGCQVAGLGGYNSIVTFNCKRIRNMGIGLTSGNALTIGMCLRAAEEVTTTLAIQTETVAVIGAAGNIGKAYAMCLAPRVRNLVLIVRRPHSRRSHRLVAQLKESFPATHIELTSSMTNLQRCQLIIGASNSPTPIIFAEHVGNQPSVICDVALPSDVCPELPRVHPHVRVIRGGIVRLPSNEDLTLSGLNLPPGRVFACISETLLMGLADMRNHGSYGEISAGQVEQMLNLADLHGFRHEVLFRETTNNNGH